MRRSFIQVVLIASEFSNAAAKTSEHSKPGCHTGIDLPAVAGEEILKLILIMQHEMTYLSDEHDEFVTVGAKEDRMRNTQ